MNTSPLSAQKKKIVSEAVINLRDVITIPKCQQDPVELVNSYPPKFTFLEDTNGADYFEEGILDKKIYARLKNFFGFTWDGPETYTPSAEKLPFIPLTFPLVYGEEFAKIKEPIYMRQKRILLDNLETLFNVDLGTVCTEKTYSRNKPRLYYSVIKDPIRSILLDNGNKIITKMYDISNISNGDFLDIYDYLLDVMVGYCALNRLTFAHANVVTPHFAFKLDWHLGPFLEMKYGPAMPNLQQPKTTGRQQRTQARKGAMFLPPEPEIDHSKTSRGTPVNNIRFNWQRPSFSIIEERADKHVQDVIEWYSLNELTVMFFQVLYSLESFWLLYGGIHNDLNVTNLMTINVNFPESPYNETTWLYKRFNSGAGDSCYVFPPQVHQHVFVKIIDFGRSRAWISTDNEGTIAKRSLVGPFGFCNSSQNLINIDLSRDSRLFGYLLLKHRSFKMVRETAMRDDSQAPAITDAHFREFVLAVAHVVNIEHMARILVEKLEASTLREETQTFLETILSEARDRSEAITEEKLFEMTMKINQEFFSNHRMVSVYVNDVYDLFFNAPLYQQSEAKSTTGQVNVPTPSSTLDLPLFKRFLVTGPLPNEPNKPRAVVVGECNPQDIMADPFCNNDSSLLNGMNNPYTGYLNESIAQHRARFITPFAPPSLVSNACKQCGNQTCSAQCEHALDETITEMITV